MRIAPMQTAIPGRETYFVIRLYNFFANSANLFATLCVNLLFPTNTNLSLICAVKSRRVFGSAVDMASWFLPAGKVIVREDFANGEPENAYRKQGLRHI